MAIKSRIAPLTLKYRLKHKNPARNSGVFLRLYHLIIYRGYDNIVVQFIAVLKDRYHEKQTHTQAKSG